MDPIQQNEREVALQRDGLLRLQMEYTNFLAHQIDDFDLNENGGLPGYEWTIGWRRGKLVERLQIAQRQLRNIQQGPPESSVQQLIKMPQPPDHS